MAAMAIEDSHPLALVPELFDQLTPFERRRTLTAWNVQYEAANRLVHPVTRRRRPESITRSAILRAISAKYQIWIYLALVVIVNLAVSAALGSAVSPGFVCAGLVATSVAVAAGLRWRERRRLVTDYFEEHFPDGPSALPDRR